MRTPAQRISAALGIALAVAACRGATLPAPPVAADASPPPAPEAAPPQRFDLVLAHGTVLDTASGRNGRFDVGVRDGRVVAIAPALDAGDGARVIDATGRYVVAGLVDLHTHLFVGSDRARFLAGSPLAVRADEVGPSSCATTLVDAGSVGHRSYPRFHDEVVARSRTRVLAFLNIVGEGMRGGAFEQRTDDMDASATAQMITAHAGEIVGVKVAHYQGRGWEPFDRAELAAQSTGTRVMVDFGNASSERPLEALFTAHMHAGDIYTHAFAELRGRPAVVGADGAVLASTRAARERGILFDVGYGGASFAFSQAKPAVAAGFYPDTISTDAHGRSRRTSMHDLLEVMSKLASLGMPLVDVVRATTERPADAIGRRDLGRIAEGAVADLAVLSVEAGKFDYEDVKRVHEQGAVHLACEVTVRAGAVVWQRSR